ncbi:hypothetical protein AX17_002569 [Amanita inopinata Kibby_2008]|nr:hypothetical protein AX17_002569 [Amanita inopinata Kibby_2008]
MIEFDISRVNDEVYSEEKTRAIRRSYLDAVKSLEETRATIDAPQKKKETLIRDIEYYEAALAPQKRLPDDILREIFIQYTDAYGRVTIPLYLNADCPPQLVLSHVCSSWRTLALSTGRIWSNVKVDQPADLEKPFDASITWLQRAGTVPVSLELTIPLFMFSNNFKLATLFQGPLRPVRITLLDLSIAFDRIAELFALPDDALPHVQEIRIATVIEPDFLPSRTPSFICHTRYLLCGPAHVDNYVLRMVAFPWGQMRHLSLCTPMTATDCLDLLSQMISLEQCQLRLVNESGNNLVRHGKGVTLPKLQVFVVNGGRAEDALTTIIKSISALGMKKLVVEGILNLGKEMIAILRTRFNLCRLEEIDFCYLRDRIPIDVLLREATSMRRVVLTSGMNLEKCVLSGLAEGYFGPCLDSIEIPRGCGVQEILDMVKARRRRSESSNNQGDQKITPFKYVRFWSQENPKGFAEKIDAFKALGVEIVINGYPAAPDPDPERWSELVQPTHIYP